VVKKKKLGKRSYGSWQALGGTRNTSPPQKKEKNGQHAKGQLF